MLSTDNIFLDHVSDSPFLLHKLKTVLKQSVSVYQNWQHQTSLFQNTRSVDLYFPVGDRVAFSKSDVPPIVLPSLVACSMQQGQGKSK